MKLESLDWLSLDKGEDIVWNGEPIMKSIYPAIMTGVVLLPLAPFIIIPAYLHKKNTDFVVTTEGLYKKKGVLSRSVKKIEFDKVQNISFSQGFFGTQFDYGNIEISTAGGSGVEMRFRSIEDPKEVQETINQHIKKDKESEEDNSSEGDSMKQLVSEMKRTRQAVEEINDKL